MWIIKSVPRSKNESTTFAKKAAAASRKSQFLKFGSTQRYELLHNIALDLKLTNKTIIRTWNTKFERCQHLKKLFYRQRGCWLIFAPGYRNSDLKIVLNLKHKTIPWVRYLSFNGMLWDAVRFWFWPNWVLSNIIWSRVFR